MQLTGLLHGAPLLRHVGFPTAEVIGPDAGDDQIVDLIRRRRCDLVVNTPQGSGARGDGYRIREAALSARVPCVTTLSGARAAALAIARARRDLATTLQERIDAEARAS